MKDISKIIEQLYEDYPRGGAEEILYNSVVYLTTM